MTDRLHADAVTLAYGGRTVVHELDVTVPDGSFTVIVGPNACGKSTLLRALARLLAPSSGTVVLDGDDIRSQRPRSVARRLGLLPQSSIVPDDVTVRELVLRGRHPHQRLLRQASEEDRAAVDAALAATGTAPLADRVVQELSGGQRQRAWIAMVLAQDTPLLLLDEPTTYLDVAHQIELLDLLRRLHRDGRTLVAVLHDLNHAARYATHVIAMQDGRIAAQGTPREVVTSALVERVFGMPNVVIDDPVTGGPLVVPLDATLPAPGRTA